MRTLMHRHLGKVVAGAAVAVTGTAVMVGITLPGTAEAGAGSGTTAGQRKEVPALPPARMEDAPEEGDKGVGRDPLTDDELKRADEIASGAAQLTAGRDVEGDRGVQHLATNLGELSPAELEGGTVPRRAELTYYDYKTDSFITKTVDLAAGEVVATDTQQGVQAPASREENREATELLLASPLADDLRKDYEDATGKPLTKADQLRVHSMIFRSAADAPAPGKLADCGKHRCVRLFPKVVNGPWIDARDLVVDLSARSVGRLS
ncbi:Tat pathway signal sequence domain protein [Streptomyces sp. NPDC050418]|uniref:Tat pathway signal sequence domain protein n=1 Tax=Streptomyces sp. NPDC050418 TaxID=3365612 RepID=UPI0037B0BB7B